MTSEIVIVHDENVIIKDFSVKVFVEIKCS